MSRLSIFPILLFLVLPSMAIGKSYQAIKGESHLSYHLHHPLHEVIGTSDDFECSVELNDDTAHSKIRVKAPVVSFNSGNSSRDSHALEMLEAFKHPFVEFASDSVRHEEKGWRVFGQLTFHGMKRAQNFVVTPEYLKGKVRITGGFTIKLSDYKIARPTLMFIHTDDDLRIELDVVAAGP